MLTIGARLAPDDGSGGIVHPRPVAAHALAVALHVGLLQVGGKAVQGLLVGEHRVAAGAKEVAVPNAQQCQNDRHVVL